MMIDRTETSTTTTYSTDVELPTDLPPACRSLAIAAEQHGVYWCVERYYHPAPTLTQTIVGLWVPALDPNEDEPTFGWIDGRLSQAPLPLAAAFTRIAELR